MTDVAPAGALSTKSKTGRRAWVSFATGLEIFNIPITYVIFVPYFINTVGGDAAAGQTLWGYAAGIGGLIGALMSPPLGFAAENPSRRRMFLTVALFANAVPAFILALAAPGIAGPVLVIVLVALAVATAANDINYALLGGMLVDVAPSAIMGRTSAAAVSIGWAFGIVISLAYLGAFVMFDPFGLELDPAAGQAERLIGPIAGALMLILCLPLLLLRPPPAPVRPKRSFGIWFSEEMGVLFKERAVAIAVAARLIYWSGVTLLGLFGTGFARAVFGWDTLTAGIFGLLVLAFGVLGAFTGGRLDDKIGSRNSLIVYLIGLAISMGLILTLEPDRIFFVIELTPRALDAGPLSSPAEWAALGLGSLAGFFVGPTGPISRTLVSRLAPPGRTARYFGVAALAGNVTNFFGPVAVAVLTQATGNQRVGLLVAPGFLILGVLIVMFLPPAKEARTDEAPPTPETEAF
ncbi:MAG: MFS transporter [Maricaulaceae bacterium]|jgi:UMF1 family MFS transporter